MKIGLALEGGSRQTIFTAGVLDAWMEEDIPFSYYAGVSAGGHAAMNYITRQKGRFRHIIQPTKIQHGQDHSNKFLDGPRKECHALHYDAAYGDIPFDFDALAAQNRPNLELRQAFRRVGLVLDVAHGHRLGQSVVGC